MIFITVLFLASFQNITVSASSAVIQNNITSTTTRDHPVIDTIIRFFVNTFRPIYQFNTEAPFVEPDTIEIGYNESAVIDIGLIDLLEGDETTWAKDPGLHFVRGRILEFQAEVLDGNPNGRWFINFDNPTIYSQKGTTLKTKATIKLTAPPIASNPIQSTTIRFKIIDSWIMGSTMWPEDNRRVSSKIMWFFAGIMGKWYTFSGSVQADEYSVDLLVKVKQYHAVRIEAASLTRMQPDKTISLPITIENIGNYNDTFSFQVVGNLQNIKVVNPGFISLKPGETGHTLLAVASPELMLDTGTLNEITVKIFSIEEPQKILANHKIFLETQGLYLSEVMIASFGLGIFFIILIFMLFVYLIHQHDIKFLQKPSKPWTIPEEQAHLEELKKQNREAFEQERLMMEEEYKSAMLWYKNYLKALKREPKKRKRRYKYKTKKG